MKKTLYHCLVATSLLSTVTTATFLTPFVVQANDKGTFTVGNSVLNVRRSPSTSGEKVASYQPGDKINYDEIVVNDGYRWISYVGASGNRNYVAVGTADGAQSFGSLSGASYSSSSASSSTNSSAEIARIAGEWQSESGNIITIDNDGRITPSTLDAVVSWDGTKFVAPQILLFEYDEVTDVITYQAMGVGGSFGTYGMSEAEIAEANRKAEENYRKMRTYHRVGSKSEVITQSEEPKKGEEVVANQPTEAEKELIAKVWNQLGAKQYNYYVYRRPAGTPVNYYNGVGENYPEVTYLLAEDVNQSGNPNAMSTEVLFSDNGDGTITLYKYIKKWHFSPDKFEEATKDHLADTEIVKLEDISSSEQEAMLQLITKYEGFEESAKDSVSNTEKSQVDKETESSTVSSSQKGTTKSSSSSETKQAEISSSSTSTSTSDSTSYNKSKGNVAQRIYKIITNRKTLPSTGESISVLGGIGLLLVGAAIYFMKKKN